VDDPRGERPGLAGVLVTHHLAELPASTTRAPVPRDGRTVVAGPAGAVPTGAVIGDAFRHPVTIRRAAGRWHATAATRRSR
jgi:iron complex transport system ATP-binding protein